MRLKNIVNNILLYIVSSVFCMFSVIVSANSIQADRPGFSTGTYTVKPGFKHIEIGIQYDKESAKSGNNSITLPLLNYRLGLTKETELNILWDGWDKLDGDSSMHSNDLKVGLKQRLLNGDEFNLSWIGYVTLPTGSKSEANHFNPFLGLLWDYSISERTTVFGTIQIDSFVEYSKRYNQFQPAIGLSFVHTEKVSVYVEFYTDLSLNDNPPPASVINSGLTYLLTPSIQLDVNLGYSTDRRTSDFIGFGMAIRF